MKRRVIGIDLGTLNSCVAAVREGRAEVLQADNRNTIPSCVAFANGKQLVGAAARRHAVTEPQSTIIAVKRLIGHAFDSREVQEAARRLPYKVKKSRLGSVVLQVGDEELSPVQVSALILTRIREIAEQALGGTVSSAVISVPAHFNDVQRKATILAGEDAGLEVLRLINEPTAAAFAYGYKKETDFTLAVYDLGGGTFDVTILRSSGDTFSVIATDGDSYLGGEDFDFVIADWLEQEFEREFGQNLQNDAVARIRLKEAAEKAKIELTEVETSRVELPFLTELPNGSRPNFTRSITRQRVNELVGPLIKRTLELSERCLESAGVSVSEINEVLLVGGQSRMPAVRDGVRRLFDREPRRDINPDEVVAIGAALYAYSLVADDLEESAKAEAEEAFAVAVKGTAVARKVVKEIANLGSGELDNQALANRLEALLKIAEGGDLEDELDDQDDPTQDSLLSLGTPPTEPDEAVLAPTPALPAARMSSVSLQSPERAALAQEPPQDDFPVPKLPDPTPAVARARVAPEPPQDDFPVPKLPDPTPAVARARVAPEPPQDDFPVPKLPDPLPAVARAQPEPEERTPTPLELEFEFDEPTPTPTSSSDAGVDPLEAALAAAEARALREPDDEEPTPPIPAVSSPALVPADPDPLEAVLAAAQSRARAEPPEQQLAQPWKPEPERPVAVDDLPAVAAPKAAAPLELDDIDFPADDVDDQAEAPEAASALDYGNVELGLDEPEDVSLIGNSEPRYEYEEVELRSDELSDSELPAARDNAPARQTRAGAAPPEHDLVDLELSSDEIEGYDTDMDLPTRERGSDLNLPTTLDAAAVARLNADLSLLGDSAMEVIRKLEASGVAADLPELMARAKELLSNTVGGAQEATQRAGESLEEARGHSTARRVELLDVTSLPVGIASAGDLFSVLIEQNVTVPAEHQRVFTTNQDGQSEVEIRVFQGRGKRVAENQYLGSFILQGIPPARRMEPRIQVTFLIDENGILSVRARDQGSGVQREIRVEDPLALMADPTREAPNRK